MAVLTEQLIIGIHQLTLAHRCRSLLAGHVLGPSGKAQLAAAHANGTGGHQNHLMSRIFDIAEHLTKQLHPANVQPSALMGQGGGSNFYDDPHGIPSFCALRTYVYIRKIVQDYTGECNRKKQQKKENGGFCLRFI